MPKIAVTHTCAKSAQKRCAYDSFQIGSRRKIPSPNHVTRHAYDTESHLTDIYDANNNHTQFSWINGHIYRTTFQSGYYEGYTWDGTNQYLTSKTDRIGNAVYYSYDPQNRLYQWAGSYTATYDPAGRMTKVADSSTSSTWSFAYDNINRLTQTTTKYGFLSSRNTFTVGYGYDAASNRTSLTDPENGLTQYTYDTLNRLTNLQDFQSHNFGFSYDQLSRRTQLTRPNGVNTNYTYDNLSHLLSVLHQAGSTTLDGASYTYDAAGNRSSKTDQLANLTTNYGYDAIYQLLQATRGTTTTESYTYDAVGNRLSSLGMSPYQYNSSNELTSTPTTTYTYDQDGELTKKVDSTGTTTYNWNTQNQLTSVVLPGSGGTVSFKYDPFGRRIQKSLSSATTNYLYDGPNAIEEVDQAGNVLARYTQAREIDDSLAMLRSGTTSYYEADGVASITSLSNNAGALANTYTFDSFGHLTAHTGTLTNPFQYTGREFDSETGINYYRARYYDPTIGRFLSEDPWDQGPNLYAYVDNDPTNLVDPLGLYTIAPPRPGHPITPPPSPALDNLLHCIENRLHISLTVTSTTEGHHQDPGHAAGTTVDIRPPSGVSADTLFCAAGQCGSQWGINEGPTGSPTPLTTAYNYHIQLRPPNNPHPKSKNAIPPGCTPGGCSGAK